MSDKKNDTSLLEIAHQVVKELKEKEEKKRDRKRQKPAFRQTYLNEGGVLGYEEYLDAMEVTLADYAALMDARKKTRKRLFDLGLLDPYPDIKRCAEPFYECMNEKKSKISAEQGKAVPKKKEKWEACRKRMAEKCEGYALFLQPVSRYWSTTSSKKKSPRSTTALGQTSNIAQGQNEMEAAKRQSFSAAVTTNDDWDKVFESAANETEEEDNDEPPSIPALSPVPLTPAADVEDLKRGVRAFSALLDAIPAFLSKMTELSRDTAVAGTAAIAAAFSAFFKSAQTDRETVAKLAIAVDTHASVQEAKLVRAVMLLTRQVMTITDALVDLYSSIPSALYTKLDGLGGSDFFDALTRSSATVERLESSSEKDTTDLGDALQLLQRAVEKTQNTFQVFRTALGQLEKAAASASARSQQAGQIAQQVAPAPESWTDWAWKLVQKTPVTQQQVLAVRDAAHRALGSISRWWVSSSS